MSSLLADVIPADVTAPQIAALGCLIILITRVLAPPGIPYTYVWLAISGIAWKCGTVEGLSLCFVIGLTLNVSWFLSQLCVPSLWVSILGYWYGILPKRFVRTVTRVGDIVLHPCPLLLLSWSSNIVITAEICMYALLLDRLYICSSEAHPWGSGRNLNKIYKLEPKQPQPCFTTVQLLHCLCYLPVVTFCIPAGAPCRAIVCGAEVCLLARFFYVRRLRHETNDEAVAHVTTSSPSSSSSSGANANGNLLHQTRGRPAFGLTHNACMKENCHHDDDQATTRLRATTWSPRESLRTAESQQDRRTAASGDGPGAASGGMNVKADYGVQHGQTGEEPRKEEEDAEFDLEEWKADIRFTMQHMVTVGILEGKGPQQWGGAARNAVDVLIKPKLGHAVTLIATTLRYVGVS